MEGLRQSYGNPVKTMVIPDISHALFPKQPQAVAEAVIGWIRGLEAVGLGQAAQRGVRRPRLRPGPPGTMVRV